MSLWGYLAAGHAAWIAAPKPDPSRRDRAALEREKQRWAAYDPIYADMK
jgi:hypothetical protein